MIRYLCIYNDRLKKVLQNALDRLPEENTDNIEYNLFTTAPLDVEGAIRKIDNTQHGFSTDAVKIFIAEDIEKEIKNTLEALDMVSYEKLGWINQKTIWNMSLQKIMELCVMFCQHLLFNYITSMLERVCLI